ncbi:MAG: right-handed parallel beta-helix repeat-containing protein [bacterium]
MGDKKKDKKKKKPLAKIIAAAVPSILTLVIIGGAVAYQMSGTLQGKIKVWMWRGNSTLRCSGDQVIKIKDKTVDIDSIVIYAGGNCKVYLEKVDFTGRTGVYVSGNAKVTIRASKLHGRSHGIYAGGGEVVVENTKVQGKDAAIYVGSNAQVTVNGGSLDSERQGVYLSSKGSLNLTGVKVTGQRDGIYVGSNAELNTTGGTIEGKKQALYIGTDAKVSMKDTPLKGKVYTGRGATVTGMKPDKITDTVHCSGTATMTLKDKKVKLRKLIIDASGHCKLKLVNCEFHGRPVAIRARDHAQIHLVGGSYDGRKHSLEAFDYAILLVSTETKLIKKIGVASGTVVVSRPTIDVKAVAAQLEGLAAKEKGYKKGACDDFLQCYKEHRYNGQYDALIYMTPDDKGKIKKVKIDKFRGKRKIRKCLMEAAKEKTIANYEGPPGKLYCRIWGNLTGFMEAVSSRSGFLWDEQPKPKGVKPLDLPAPK